MNSFERAKQFIKNKASRLAIAIVPLAAAVVTASAAHGGVILSAQSKCDAYARSGSASCTTVQENPTGSDQNINWVGFYGSGTSDAGWWSALDFGISGGKASGTVGVETIPVSWLFDISSPSKGTVDYTVDFDLGVKTAAGNMQFPSYTFSGSASSNSVVSGSGVILIRTAGQVTQYSVSLDTDAHIDYSIDIPQGSTIDVNAAVVATPEPASLLMIPAGLAMLLLRRRRR